MTDAAQIAGETPAAEGHVPAPALPPAWTATATLAGMGVQILLVPSAPRPSGPALQAMLADLERDCRRILKPLKGADPAEALRYAAGELLPVLRARSGVERVRLLKRLANPAALLDALVDVLRCECWLAGEDVQVRDRLAEALGDAGYGPPAARWNEEGGDAAVLADARAVG